jgi:hypothetical protein
MRAIARRFYHRFFQSCGVGDGAYWHLDAERTGKTPPPLTSWEWLTERFDGFDDASFVCDGIRWFCRQNGAAFEFKVLQRVQSEEDVDVMWPFGKRVCIEGEWRRVREVVIERIVEVTVHSPAALYDLHADGSLVP